MTLKNNIIIALVQAGCLNITTTELDASQAYKTIKFRRGVQKAFEALQEAEKGIIADLKLEIGEKGVLNGPEDALAKFGELRGELYNDTSEIGDVKALPFDAWHLLKKENKGLGNAFIEDALEGILWTVPEE